MFFWIFLSLIHLFSILFCLLSLWQLFKYVRVYKFPREKYDLLLGFVHLRLICAGYGLFLFGWATLSTFFLLSIW